MLIMPNVLYGCIAILDAASCLLTIVANTLVLWDESSTAGLVVPKPLSQSCFVESAWLALVAD